MSGGGSVLQAVCCVHVCGVKDWVRTETTLTQSTISSYVLILALGGWLDVWVEAAGQLMVDPWHTLVVAWREGEKEWGGRPQTEEGRECEEEATNTTAKDELVNYGVEATAHGISALPWTTNGAKKNKINY